jgi:hypothetical protein
VAGFDAFISYSRRASTTLATDLQVAVEKFAKPWNRLRAVRVFRDDASMSANPALWSTIENGLTEAGWFILLASPAAAQSEYVAGTVSGSSSIRIQSLDPQDRITAACAVAARDLTKGDWSRYGVGPAPDDLRCVQ